MTAPRTNHEILADPGLPHSLAEGQLRMETLAQGLELVAKDEFFFMGSYLRIGCIHENYDLRKGIAGECGTAGCAIGWAPVIFPNLEFQTPPQYRTWLGIHNEAFLDITSPHAYDGNTEDITRHDAAARIREVAADPASFTVSA